MLTISTNAFQISETLMRCAKSLPSLNYDFTNCFADWIFVHAFFLFVCFIFVFFFSFWLLLLLLLLSPAFLSKLTIEGCL